MSQIKLSETLRFWLKLGFISFGGPTGQIAIMHSELVDKKRWISDKRFLHALNFCMILPGPEAQQLATYLGWLMHGLRGGILAGLLFILPSLALMILLGWAYLTFGHLPWVIGLFYGIKAAVMAVVAHALWRVGTRSLSHPLFWIIAATAFVLIFAFKVSFLWIVGLAAISGLALSYIAPSAFKPAAHGKPKSQGQDSIFDDHTLLPDHAKFKPWKSFAILISGLFLWAVPIALIWVLFGPTHTFTQMAIFFTKAALVTFGGAYAVLPYVYQGAVEQFHWVTPPQMMDALGLAESTPGPLIMIVSFVAFLGAYQAHALGVELSLWAGTLAAILVAWFTFLPSFIFVLAGAPFIEQSQKQLALTAPLAAIAASVVGVMASLALFFAYHILWPEGFESDFDFNALLIGLTAAILLFYLKQSVLRVILLSALVGVALSFFI